MELFFWGRDRKGIVLFVGFSLGMVKNQEYCKNNPELSRQQHQS